MVLSSFRDPGQGKWLDNQSGRAEATSGWVTIDKRECVIGKQIQTSLLYRMFPHGRQGGHNGVPKNETAAMLELQYNPVAVELWFWYANVFLFSNKFVKMLASWVKTPYSILVSSGLYFRIVLLKMLRFQALSISLRSEFISSHVIWWWRPGVGECKLLM